MSELKLIDMSVLLGSDVLCEFWDGSKRKAHSYSIGKLNDIVADIEVHEHEPFFMSQLRFGSEQYEYRKCFESCRPLINHWISNAEGNLVLPDGLMVDAAMRDDDFFINGYEPKFMTAKRNLIDLNNRREIYPLAFHPIMEAAQIIAVRITGLAEGYCWSKS